MLSTNNTSQYIIENRLIVLNSKDGRKLNGEYLSSIDFSFYDLLKNEPDIIRVGIALLSAEIPVSFYNINEYNNTLSYTVNSVNYTLTVPESNYSSATFITTFTTLFNAAGHGQSLSISVSRASGLLTFTKTGALNVIFNSSSMYSVLGLLDDTTYTLSTTLTTPHQMNLLGVKKLKISSPSLSLENHDSRSRTCAHLIHTISITHPPYALQTYENNHLSLMHVKNRSINTLQIDIRDEDHNLIDFNNGHWCMTLCLSISRIYVPPKPDSLALENLAIQVDSSIPTKNELKIIIDKIDEEALETLEFLSK